MTIVTDRHLKFQFTKADVQVSTTKVFILLGRRLRHRLSSLGRLNVLLFGCRKLLCSVSMKPFSYGRTAGGGEEENESKVHSKQLGSGRQKCGYRSTHVIGL
jgi:hypothetical protein